LLPKKQLFLFQDLTLLHQ